MPFALTFVGLILIVTGFQNTYKQFGQQVSGDFTGPNNFLYWMAAIIIIGGLGYAKSLESFSRAFMSLIVLALVFSAYRQNPNIFSDIGSSIASGSATPVRQIGAPLPASSGGGGSGGSPLDGISGGAFDTSTLSSLVTPDNIATAGEFLAFA